MNAQRFPHLNTYIVVEEMYLEAFDSAHVGPSSCHLRASRGLLPVFKFFLSLDLGKGL